MANRPVVIAGPSGVGKSTNIKRLMAEDPQGYGFSVSHTTRAPRPGETEGQAYHFVTQPEFDKLVESSSFLEHAVYSGNSYGTSIKAVRDVSEAGRVCLLDIDMQGVQTIKGIPKSQLDPFYITLVPQSIELLRDRLESRGDTTPRSIEKRLDMATREVELSRTPGYFDRVVESIEGDVDTTYAAFKQAILDSQKNH